VNSYGRLCSSVIFPLHEKLKGHASVAVRKRLERSQWRTVAEIESEQADRLRNFLVRIGAEVPYYRKLFDRLGFDPRSADSARSLLSIPLMGKAEIRANGDAMKADGHGRLTRYNTGGSSGEPLTFWIGIDRKSHDVAAKWRATRWWDVDIGDPEIVVWGSPIEHGAQDRIRRLRDQVMRSRLLPAFEMSEAGLDRFVATIHSSRPRMLFGYPSALSHIARHAERRGVRLDRCGIKVAFVTAERLYDDQRERIARVFDCQVANGYGSRDAGFIAHECPTGGMHISAEDIIVELVDAKGDPVPVGTAGEIVVTHLATHEFPFLRYRTGDIATLDQRECACGRGLPMLREIQGRTTDFVVASDGTVMHGLSLIYVMRDLPDVHAFRIVQESDRLTRVELVPEPGFDPSVCATIVAGFKRRLGPEVQIQVDLVDTIPAEKSGKFRYVLSRALDPA
jgi:phenylacetate-CoA ligase